MENLYFYIIILLCILAVVDLVVGVSNDAVNFLNSAIGSGAISFRNLLILASFGILIGALSSSGMMEVARKGIFNPDAFTFDDIIIIFLSVMLADIILLDFFNTLGLPTSTTVSIVFELLGAAVIMGFLKIIESESSFSTIENYINTAKATQIILGIGFSVVFAFSIGHFVQWVSRFLLTFRFDEKPRWQSAFFGGIALTVILYFIVIKGLKTVNLGMFTFLKIYPANNIVFLLVIFIILFLLCWFLIVVFKINIYKIIIAIGTFSLALAFAGNDLVNFIGVPVAAYQSYQLWVDSGLSAQNFNMGVLESKVPAPTLFLMISGIVMIITLWVSSKAQKVVKTSLDLSNQNETKERFQSNIIARVLVTFFSFINKLISAFTPKQIKYQIHNRFKFSNKTHFKGMGAKKLPSFDMLRASVNLLVAALLIAVATSFKLPLSTTYVTFMVAMGASLADRAWDKDSAIYRVAGVVNVILGWFITAISAFLICGIILFLIKKIGVIAIIGILILAFFSLWKSHLKHKKEIRN